MLTIKLSDSTTYSKFFEPIANLFPQCSHQRSCPTISDEQWVHQNIFRVISDSKSGRGFLQQFGVHFRSQPTTGHYFEALKSGRRLQLCAELNTLLCEQRAKELPDPLAQFAELEKFDVHAGDGHWHGAAAHDEAKDGRKWAVGHFYSLNLRSHGIRHLECADQVGRKHEHDMRALKRQSVEDLRQKAAKGRKVLYAWDSACLDYEAWDCWKRRGGVYFVTREKDGLVFNLLDRRKIDSENPVNAGIISDDLVNPAVGGGLRRIVCEDPATGKRHVFLTNELTLPPGLLAQIYRLRWDVEKAFDQFKNALHETKAWASSSNAKSMQAHFLCLAHNLLLLFETLMKNTYSIINKAEICRKAKRLDELKTQAAKAQREVSLVYSVVRRSTKRSLKFIRTLRTFFFLNVPLENLVRRLRYLYATL